MRCLFIRSLCALLVLCLLAPCAAAEVSITMLEEETEVSLGFDVSQTPSPSEAPAAETPAADAPAATVQPTEARQELIEGILSLAEKTYEETGGRAKRAQYSGDIYVCKNFTVYLFRQNAGAYRMAEFPDTPLVIPDNKPRDECAPYVYGLEWKDIPAEKGNPFYAAASFRYDTNKSAEENRELAREFLKQAKRGDYFQMAAKYYYGVGAHSMIISGDYDPETDTITWCDSNMKGEKRNGERYGYVQYNAVKEIDWFVDAFCRKKHGATLYRLRDDIIRAE